MGRAAACRPCSWAFVGLVLHAAGSCMNSTNTTINIHSDNIYINNTCARQFTCKIHRVGHGETWQQAMDRASLLTPKPKQRTMARIPFVSSFGPMTGRIGQIIIVVLVLFVCGPVVWSIGLIGAQLWGRCVAACFVLFWWIDGGGHFVYFWMQSYRSIFPLDIWGPVESVPYLGSCIFMPHTSGRSIPPFSSGNDPYFASIVCNPVGHSIPSKLYPNSFTPALRTSVPGPSGKRHGPQVKFSLNLPADCNPTPEPRPMPSTSTPILPSTSCHPTGLDMKYLKRNASVPVKVPKNMNGANSGEPKPALTKPGSSPILSAYFPGQQPRLPAS